MNDLFKVVDALLEFPGKTDPLDHSYLENKILRSVLNSLTEGVIVADQTGKFLYFNDSAQNILGIGFREMEIREWTSVYGCFYEDTVTPFPAEELPLVKAIQDIDVLNEVIFIKNEHRPEGIYINVSASPLKDGEGNIQGGTVIFGDITQRKLAEISHQQSEQRVIAQFKGIPIPTYVWQKKEDDYILIDYNTASEKITRNEIHQFKGSRLSEMYAHAPEIRELFLKCMAENSPLSQEMSYQMFSSGETRELIVHFVKIPPDMVLVHTVDVTEMKNNERELKKLSNAVDQTADSVLITDKTGIIEYINPAFEKTTGYTREEILGRSPSLLKSGIHDQKFYRQLWSTIAGGNVYEGTIINRKKSGDTYWSEQTITPMHDEKGQITHYVSVLRDITDRKKREEQEIQIRLAREVQSQLYRTEITIKGLDVSGISIPAAETNGDYYDILQMNDHTWGIVIGDVSGHGISSALIMAQTRAYLHAFTRHESDPGILLTWLNQELVKDLDEIHFVTLALVQIDVQRHSMIYASAGHIPGYLFNAAGEIRQTLESTGIPLGFIPDYQYKNSPLIHLKANDSFILLTDGIVEAHDQQDAEFGLEKTLKVIRKNRNRSIRKIQKQLHQAVLDFFADQPQEDDITSVICKFDPEITHQVAMTDCIHSAMMK